MGQKFQDSTAVYQTTWTSATAQNTTLNTYGWGYSTAIITVQNTGTVTPGVLTFYGYDGYNYYPLNGVQLSNGSPISTYTLGNGSDSIAVDITAFQAFRVKLTTAITGSGSSLITINESAASISSIAKDNQTSIATANTPAIISSATALAANQNRHGWQIQNVGTNPLFVLLGSGASTTVFHAVLKAGTGASDGTGGSISQTSGVIYTGLISVAGTSPSYVVLEM
jgi:hypothetical protein